MSNIYPGLFLVAAERSGTTMLRLMLDSHPEITWQNEFEFAIDQMTDEGVAPELNEYYKWLKYHRIFRSSGLEIITDLSYPELVRHFLYQRQRKFDSKIVGATIHRHFNRLSYLWPNARYIHLVRDGRDVAKSNIGMGWAGNLYTGASRWLDAEGEWGVFKSKLSAGQYLEVSYERLLSDTENELTKIASFIRVSYSEKMLSYPEKTTYSKPDKKHVQSWKGGFTDKDIQLSESVMSEMLLERGYELSGLPIIQCGKIKSLYLKFQDRMYRINRRIKLYGLYLFLMEMMTRRFGLMSWWGCFKLKVNDVEIENLK